MSKRWGRVGWPRMRHGKLLLAVVPMVGLIAAAAVADDLERPAGPQTDAAIVAHMSHTGGEADWCAFHFVRGEFRLAIEDCDKALRADSTDAQLYLNRGAAHLMIGEPLSAMSDFESGLLLKPEDADLHFNRATVFTSRGEDADAIAAYTEAIRLNPRFLPPYINRGSTFDRLGEREKAIADYRKALELAPSLTVIRKRLRQLGAD